MSPLHIESVSSAPSVSQSVSQSVIQSIQYSFTQFLRHTQVSASSTTLSQPLHCSHSINPSIFSMLASQFTRHSLKHSQSLCCNSHSHRQPATSSLTVHMITDDVTTTTTPLVTDIHHTIPPYHQTTHLTPDTIHATLLRSHPHQRPPQALTLKRFASVTASPPSFLPQFIFPYYPEFAPSHRSSFSLSLPSSPLLKTSSDYSVQQIVSR